jgi:hypothetical protein
MFVWVNLRLLLNDECMDHTSVAERRKSSFDCHPLVGVHITDFPLKFSTHPCQNSFYLKMTLLYISYLLRLLLNLYLLA